MRKELSAIPILLIGLVMLFPAPSLSGQEPADSGQEAEAKQKPQDLKALLDGAKAALAAAAKNNAYSTIPAVEAEWAAKIEKYLEENPKATPKDQAWLLLVSLYGQGENAGVKIKSLYDQVKADGAKEPWFLAFLRLAYYQLHGKNPEILLDLLADAEGAATRQEAKAAAVYYRGELLLATGKGAEAKALFEKLAKEFPDSPYRESAQGNLQEIDHLQPGMPAPDFKIPGLDNKEITLSALKGQVVLLVFWTHWAPLLPKRIPDLVKLFNQHQANPFALIGISLDEAGEIGAVKKAVADLGMAWPTGFDGQGWKGPVAKQYNIKVAPRAFLIDSQGKILFTDLFHRINTMHLVNDQVAKRKAVIQKQEADKKKAEAEKKKAAEAAKKAAEAAKKPPVKK